MRLSNEDFAMSGYEYASADYQEETEKQARSVRLIMVRDNYWDEPGEWIPFDIRVGGWAAQKKKEAKKPLVTPPKKAPAAPKPAPAPAVSAPPAAATPASPAAGKTP
jgi:hypothetical protein